jgi:hypothetical protein
MARVTPSIYMSPGRVHSCHLWNTEVKRCFAMMIMILLWSFQDIRMYSWRKRESLRDRARAVGRGPAAPSGTSAPDAPWPGAGGPDCQGAAT